MKKLSPFFLSLLIVSLAMAGCGKDETGGRIELPDVDIPVIVSGGGTQTLTFKADADWTISVSDTKASQWCTVAPSSGQAGTISVAVTALANPEKEDRTAEISIHAGKTVVKTTVTQKRKGAFELEQSTYTVPAEGGDIDIPFKSNIGPESILAEEMTAYRDWLSVLQTKAMDARSLSIRVARNPDATPRTGKVVIRENGSKTADTLTITQKATSMIRLKEKAVNAPYYENTLSVELQANVEYKVNIPDAARSWIEEDKTGTSQSGITQTVKFNIVANPRREATRQAQIILRGTVETNVADTLYLTQLAAVHFDGEIITLQKGTKGNVDIVFMGDGFTKDDMDQDDGHFITAMKDAVDYFFDIEPYITYREYFNIYAVCAVSEESGVSDLKVTKKTKFSVRFTDPEGQGTGMSCNENTVFNYAKKAPIKRIEDCQVVLIANSPRYAGTTWSWGDGSSIAICPMIVNTPPNDFRGVVQHEAGGHGFAKLADEYIYYSQTIPASRLAELKQWTLYGHNANIDLTNDRTKIKWRHYFTMPDYARVGAFEGSSLYAYGVWRAESNSCMNNNVPYFNTPSREKIVSRIMELSGKTFDFDDFIARDAVVINAPIPDKAPSKSVAGESLPFAPPVLQLGSPQGN